MKVKNDHRSKFSNLSNWKAEAWKKVRALLLLLFHRVQFEKMTQKKKWRKFQARNQDILRGDAIQRGDGPNQAGGLTLKEGGGGWGN